MLRPDVPALSAALRASRVPFVHALVVLAESPTSARPGDEAIVRADGALDGFVGGTCAESTVREQSLEVLRTGEAMVLRITPVAEADQPGKRVVHNPCLSGGTIEIFLEPRLPPPLVVVVGDAPIAHAVRSIAGGLRYSVEAFDGHLPADTAAVVVASHGRNEERALTAALEAGVPYIGLVASARRGRAVLDGLPVGEELAARVHTPAGLDIGAATPEEVALAILAEIVASRPSATHPAHVNPVAHVTPGDSDRPRPGVGPGAASETDPVCGMTVFPDDDTFRLDGGGEHVWFCGRGCMEAFAADPAAYRS